MACTAYIRSELALYPPGSTWVYNGFDLLDDNGDFDDIPTQGIVNVPAGTDLSAWGDDFLINAENKTPGYYKFTYSDNGTPRVLVLQIYDVQAGACAGANASVQYASDNNTVQDLSVLIVTPGCPNLPNTGTWIDLDGAGAAFVAPNFTPDQVSPGTYRFEYRLSDPDFVLANCRECDLVTALVTVEVTDDLNGTIASNEVNCTYTLTFENPDDQTINQAKLTIQTDSTDILAQYDKRVTDCRDTSVETVNIQSSVAAIRLASNSPFVAGGIMSLLVLKDTTSTNVAIPLAPSTAVLSGAHGTTTANDLTYNPLSPQIFISALEIAIHNYLNIQGYVKDTDYQIHKIYTDVDDYLYFEFKCKHNPSGLWMGIAKNESSITYFYDGLNLEVVNSVFGDVVDDKIITESFTKVPCPTIQITELTIDMPSGTSGTMDFDTIVLDATVAPISVKGNNEQTCTEYQLTTTIDNCSGSLSYLWNTGETSSSIYVSSGSYNVTISCDSPVDSINLSITVP